MIGCLTGIPIDLNKLILMSSSVVLAAITFILLKKINMSTNSKIALIYGHILFLFFPVVLLTTNITCGAGCVMSCYNNIYTLAAISLPTTLIAGTAASFFIIPAIYILYNKKRQLENKKILSFIKKHSKRLKIKEPNVYVVDTANPMAFSFRSFKSAIFLSAGLLDILDKKETEAVVLHELGHIKRRASMLNASFSLLKIFTPFSIVSRFHFDSYREEMVADQFAISIQGSNKWIKSAKKKLNEFQKERG